MLRWFRERKAASSLVQADAQALIRDHSKAAYFEARRRQRDLAPPDDATHPGRTPEHWRKVALVVAKLTGHIVGTDTATRMGNRQSRSNQGK